MLCESLQLRTCWLRLTNRKMKGPWMCSMTPSPSKCRRLEARRFWCNQVLDPSRILADSRGCLFACFIRVDPLGLKNHQEMPVQPRAFWEPQSCRIGRRHREIRQIERIIPCSDAWKAVNAREFVNIHSGFCALTVYIILYNRCYDMIFYGWRKEEQHRPDTQDVSRLGHFDMWWTRWVFENSVPSRIVAWGIENFAQREISDWTLGSVLVTPPPTVIVPQHLHWLWMMMKEMCRGWMVSYIVT